jgi:hypothetical protein
MVTELGVKWPLRWPSLWALEASVPFACRVPSDPTDRLLEQRVRDELWADLSRDAPRMIMVQRIPGGMHPHPGRRSIVDHLKRDPRFARLFGDYVPVDTVWLGPRSPLTVLRRKESIVRAGTVVP